MWLAFLFESRTKYFPPFRKQCFAFLRVNFLKINIGNAYQCLGDYRKAIEYHEKSLKIDIEIGDRGGEGSAYGSLGNAYQCLGDYRKAIKYHEKSLKIAIEIVIEVEKEEPMQISVMHTTHWVTIKKPLITLKNL